MHAHTDPGTRPVNVYADHATPGRLQFPETAARPSRQTPATAG